MGFFEDLFEGRRGGHHGGYSGDGRHHDHHDEHDHHGAYRGPDPHPPSETRGPQTACGRCQAPVVVLPGFRFCPYCGAALTPASACSSCGAVRVPGAAFCSGCGARY